LQGLLLRVEISEIIAHEGDEPHAVIDFLDAELLACQDGRDVDPFAMQAESMSPQAIRAFHQSLRRLSAYPPVLKP